MTVINQQIDINPTYLEIAQHVLNEHVHDCEVRVFGSRAKWNTSNYSDLDLAIIGDRPLEWRILSRLEIAFEESDLPFRIDLLDGHDIYDLRDALLLKLTSRLHAFLKYKELLSV